MTERTLIPTAPIVAGCIVKTPAGHRAIVVHVNPQRGEATVETLPERIDFRTSKLIFLAFGTPEAEQDPGGVGETGN